eukprot:380431-Prymnesium_polylepis.1
MEVVLALRLENVYRPPEQARRVREEGMAVGTHPDVDSHPATASDINYLRLTETPGMHPHWACTRRRGSGRLVQVSPLGVQLTTRVHCAYTAG